jgi:hypothetical protein
VESAPVEETSAEESTIIVKEAESRLEVEGIVIGVIEALFEQEDETPPAPSIVGQPLRI